MTITRTTRRLGAALLGLASLTCASVAATGPAHATLPVFLAPTSTRIGPGQLAVTLAGTSEVSTPTAPYPVVVAMKGDGSAKRAVLRLSASVAETVVAISHDGRRVLTNRGGTTAAIYDLATHRTITGAGLALGFVNDSGTSVWTSSGPDGKQVIRRMDSANGRVLQTITSLGSQYMFLSPNGKQYVSQAASGAMTVYSVSPRKVVRTLSRPTQYEKCDPLRWESASQFTAYCFSTSKRVGNVFSYNPASATPSGVTTRLPQSDSWFGYNDARKVSGGWIVTPNKPASEYWSPFLWKSTGKTFLFPDFWMTTETYGSTAYGVVGGTELDPEMRPVTVMKVNLTTGVASTVLSDSVYWPRTIDDVDVTK